MDLECGLCSGILTDPVHLGCAHNACFQCIDKFAKQKGNNVRVVACNECKTETVLDKNLGAAGLPPNEAIAKVLEKLRAKTGSYVAVVMCGLCEGTKATIECEQCQVPLCQGCSEYLHNKGMYKFHSVTPLGKAPAAPESIRKAANTIWRMCEEHDKPLDLFCAEHEVIVCSHCLLVGSHHNHQCISLRDAAKMCRERVNRVAELATLKRDMYARSKKTLEALLPMVHEQFTCSNEAIVEKFAELRALIDRREHELIEQMCQVRDAKMIVLTTQIETVSAELSKANENLANESRFRELSNETDVILRSKPLVHALDLTATLPNPDPPGVSDTFNVTFADTLASAVVAFGSVDTSEVTPQLANEIELRAVRLEKARQHQQQHQQNHHHHHHSSNNSSSGNLSQPQQNHQNNGQQQQQQQQQQAALGSLTPRRDSSEMSGKPRPEHSGNPIPITNGSNSSSTSLSQNPHLQPQAQATRIFESNTPPEHLNSPRGPHSNHNSGTNSGGQSIAATIAAVTAGVKASPQSKGKGVSGDGGIPVNGSPIKLNGPAPPPSFRKQGPGAPVASYDMFGRMYYA